MNGNPFQEARAKLSKLSSGKALDSVISDIQALDSTFKSLDGIARATNQIHFRIAQRLIPFVRQLLAANYTASGLGRRSGRLYAAAVTGAVIDVAPGVLKIRFAPGQSGKVYKYGASQNYGYVRGATALGAKAKKTFKKAVLRGQKVSKRVAAGHASRGIDVGALKVVAGKDFFKITETQNMLIQTRYIKLFQEEVDLAIRKNERQRRVA